MIVRIALPFMWSLIRQHIPPHNPYGVEFQQLIVRHGAHRLSEFASGPQEKERKCCRAVKRDREYLHTVRGLVGVYPEIIH